MKRTVLLLLAGAAVLLGVLVCLGLLDVHLLSHSSIGHADRSVDQTLARHRTHPLNDVTGWVTDAADTVPVIGVAAIALAAARRCFGRWREALFLVCTVVGEVMIFVTTTLLVHRARPNVVRLDHAPPTSSFPSGHTAAAVALYGAIAILVVRYRPRIGWRRLAVFVAFCWPIVVASSRLYRGMHYPTDVVAGALLGLSWLWVSAQLLLDSPVPRRVALDSAPKPATVSADAAG